MAGPRRSNPLALAVLVSLRERPMHPYEVAQLLRTRAKEDSVRLNYGSLYSVVDGLERRGLIRVKETVREGRRPERTIYEITDTGIREAADWLSELLAVPAKEYPQFMAGLSFIAFLHPDEVVEALQSRAQAMQLRLLHMRGLLQASTDAGLPRLFSLEGEYEQRLLEAEAGFVADLVADIEAGSLGGFDLWRSFFAGEDSWAAVEVRFDQPRALPPPDPGVPAERDD